MGSGKGATISAGSLLGEPGVASFSGDPEGFGLEGSGDGHHSSWRPAGEFSKGLEEALEKGTPSKGALLSIMGVRSPGTLRDS